MKAVLVVDMPRTCGECPLCSKDENYWGDVVSAECQMQYKGYITLNEMEKPTWCPLKDLPQKIEGKREKFMPTYSLGWNDCLDAVELGLKPLWEKTE